MSGVSGVLGVARRGSRVALLSLLTVMGLLVSACASGATSFSPSGSSPVGSTPQWQECAQDAAPAQCLASLAAEADFTVEVAESFFGAVSSQELGPGCYDAAFTLGRKAWTLLSSDAVAVAAPSCETGFVHGLLVQGYPSAGAGLLSGACSDSALLSRYASDWTESMLLTCTVGAGRALAQAGQSLTSAVGVCEETMSGLTSPFDVSAKAPAFCVRGIVLDYFEGTSAVSTIVSECKTLAEPYASACLTLGARNPASRSVQSTGDLAKLCTGLVDNFRQACFFALSDALANRLFFQGSDADGEAIKACVGENDCLWHYAKYVMTATWDTDLTREACSLLATPAPKECVESIPFLLEDLKQDGHVG